MAARPKRKKTKAAAKKSAKRQAKKAVTRKVAGKKSAAKSRAKKIARKAKSVRAKPSKRPATKPAKKSARRSLASGARRPKPVVTRGPARARVTVRPRVAKRAGAAPRVPGLAIKAPLGARYGEVLTPAALRFLADLHREFEAPRERLLAARAEQQARYDAGDLPDFRTDTKGVRDDEDWRVAPIPPDLQDRRVEITGPVDRRMIVNALNSGANVFMADFEDANSPTWANNVEGQINLKDRWAGKLDFTDPDNRKHYKVGDKPPVLIVRPRGWHLVEEHLTVDGEPVSGALFDFGLYFFHNAKKNRSPPAPRPIFICRSSRPPRKRGCGTRYSCSRRSGWGCPTAASRRRC